jgi:4-amino-4-deoxy-L-arabinose transferase-like glycosyltransferase
LTHRAANTHRRTDLVLILILLFAALLRMLDLDAVRYNIDHAYPVWQALRTLDTGALPLIGQPSSVLFANPPLTGYLFLPVLAITRSVIAVYVVVILLNTAAVWFCFRTAQQLLHDHRLALIAAFLMAINPWLIEYSRTTWVQCLLPFGVSGLLWLLVPVLTGTAQRPARRLFIALVCLTALIQMYLLAYFMLLPVVTLLLIFRKRIIQQSGWRHALVGGSTIFLIVSAIYGYGLLRDPQTAFGRAGNFTAQPARLSSEALTHAVRLVTGDGYISARAPQLVASQPIFGILENAVHLLLLAALLIGLMIALRSLLQGQQTNRDHTAATILLLWFIPAILAMSYTGNAVHIFYQLLGLPAGYILAAWAVQPLFRCFDQVETKASIMLQRATGAVLIATCVGIVLLTTVNLRAAADEVRRTSGEGMQFGIPLGDGIRLSEAVDEAQTEQSDPIFTNIEPTLISTLLGRWTPVIPDTLPPEFSVIPQQGSVYVQFTGVGDQPRQPLFSHEQEILTLADGYSFALYTYPEGTVEDILQGTLAEADNTLPSGISSEQGITLHRYSLAQNRSGRWTLITFWQAEAGAASSLAGSTFGLFVHIFNPSEAEAADGERTQILNGVVVPGYLWQPGDLIVQRVRFETAEPFWLQVGFYNANTQADLIFRNESGENLSYIQLEGAETP